MKRYDAIKLISNLVSDEFIIACNGMISRELFAIRDRDRNFYMLGSMGLASAIGLGAAIARPEKKIIILAGDGNILMSLGTIATMGKVLPTNLIQVVLDNECHESTGGQETASSSLELDVVASAAGFKNSEFVDSSDVLNNVMKRALQRKEPTFITVKTNKERVEVPRVIIKPVEILKRFREELLKN